MSNEPKVLVEFTPEEIAWLADRLHEEWARALNARVAVGEKTDENASKVTTVEDHKTMTNRLRNRLLDKAHDQGFGHL